MKIELEIHKDQIELLERIKKLPQIVEDSLGKLPTSFPGGIEEIERIKELCESLEFIWKKWVLDNIITRSDFSHLLTDIEIRKKWH